jgi:hypothetical protein
VRYRKPRSLGHDGASGLVPEVAGSNSTHDSNISTLPPSLSRLSGTDFVSRVQHKLILGNKTKTVTVNGHDPKPRP